jgi:hypothetical protein
MRGGKIRTAILESSKPTFHAPRITKDSSLWQSHLRQAEAIYRKLDNASNMQLGDNLRLQAQAFLALRQYAEAEGKINVTLEIYRAASSPQICQLPNGFDSAGHDLRSDWANDGSRKVVA